MIHDVSRSSTHPSLIRLKALTVRPKTAERLFEAPHLFNEMVRFAGLNPVTNRTGALFIS
jgi:hypothetical protein